MKILNRLALFIIYIYQKTLSPDKGLLSPWLKGRICTHTPHCSAYATECFRKYPFHHALVYTFDRIMSCTPSNHIKHDPSTYRVVFASGSPIGVPFLQALMDDPRYDVVGVMCAADKAVGRGQKIRENIIKKKYKEMKDAAMKDNPPLTPPSGKEEGMLYTADQTISSPSSLIKKRLGDDSITREDNAHFDFHENATYIQENKLITNGKHLPYNPKLKERARELRKNMTFEEKILRKQYLQKCDQNVLRQKPLDHYIVDFYIPSARLIIELDGSHHYTPEGIIYDSVRDEKLKQYGLRILRIKNEDVRNSLDTVIKRIESAIHIPPLSSSTQKESNNNQTISSSPSLTQRGLGGDLLQPRSLRLTSKKYGIEASEAHDRLTDLQPDFMIVVAYGYILPQTILDIPRIAPINVHGSLLPLYRGASPIQTVFLDQQEQSGITIMLMSAGMDEGDMISKLKTKLPLHWTATDLMHRMMEHGPQHLVDSVWNYGKDIYTSTPQDDKEATHCGKIAKEDGLVDPRSDDLSSIYSKYQAYHMRPKIHFIYNNKRVIIDSIELHISTHAELDDQPVISTQNTLHPHISQLQVKPEGKKSMSRNDFVHGWL